MGKLYKVILLTMFCILLSPFTNVQAKTQTNPLQIKLKTNKITVCADTQMQITEIIKQITAPEQNIKSFVININKPGIDVKLDNTHNLCTMLYMRNKGTYRIRITVTDKQKRQASKIVKIKVLQPIRDYINRLPILKIKKHTKLTYRKIMNGISYNNKRIIGLFLKENNVKTNKKGIYTITYDMIGKHQTYSTKNAVRTVIVY